MNQVGPLQGRGGDAHPAVSSSLLLWPQRTAVSGRVGSCCHPGCRGLWGPCSQGLSWCALSWLRSSPRAPPCHLRSAGTPHASRGRGPGPTCRGARRSGALQLLFWPRALGVPDTRGGSPAPQFEGGCCQLTRTGERVPFLRARSRVCHVKTKSSFLSPVRLWNIANVTCGTRTCGTRRDVSSWRNCSIFSICVSGAVNTLIC